MSISIKNIEYYLPDNIVTNKDLKLENPEWDIDKVFQKTGIYQRHISLEGQTAFDLACEAVEKLFESGVEKNSIDGIIFCTQSHDYIMPSNSFLLHDKFDFKTEVWAFDYNLACSGFLYGIAMCRGLIMSGIAKNILLVNADTYSKYIHDKDRSTRFLFGDGAAATVIGDSSKDDSSIIDINLSTSGKLHEAFYIPHGGSRTPATDETKNVETDHSGNQRAKDNIHMNGFAVWKFISNAVPKQVTKLLNQNNVDPKLIDLFLFHQASKLTIDSLIKVLNLEHEKVPQNLKNVGNTVSASIPILMKDCINEGTLKRGDLLVVSGFGVGLSWGSALIRF